LFIIADALDSTTSLINPADHDRLFGSGHLKAGGGHL
jgi:hypothetical protein